MTSNSATEEAILEFVSSPEFLRNLHVYMESGSAPVGSGVRETLQGYLDSPLGSRAFWSFWNVSELVGPDTHHDVEAITYPVAAEAAVVLPDAAEYTEDWARAQPWYRAKGEGPEHE